MDHMYCTYVTIMMTVSYFSACLSHMTKSMSRRFAGAVLDQSASDCWKGFSPESLLYSSDQ